MLRLSVKSNALQPRKLKPARLHCPWDSPGKNTGVGCHFLLRGIFPTQGLKLSLASPVLASRFFTTVLPGKPLRDYISAQKESISFINTCFDTVKSLLLLFIVESLTYCSQSSGTHSFLGCPNSFMKPLDYFLTKKL